MQFNLKVFSWHHRHTHTHTHSHTLSDAVVPKEDILQKDFRIFVTLDDDEVVGDEQLVEIVQSCNIKEKVMDNLTKRT